MQDPSTVVNRLRYAIERMNDGEFVHPILLEDAAQVIEYLIAKLEQDEIITTERKRILDRWIEIHKTGKWVKDYAAFLALDELSKQENYPPYDKKI